MFSGIGTAAFIGQSFKTRLSGLVYWVRSNVSARPIVELQVHLAAKAGDPEHPARSYFQARHDLLAQHFVDLAQTGSHCLLLEPEKVAQIVVALVDGLLARSLFEEIRDAAELVAELGPLLFRECQPQGTS